MHTRRVGAALRRRWAAGAAVIALSTAALVTYDVSSGMVDETGTTAGLGAAAAVLADDATIVIDRGGVRSGFSPSQVNITAGAL